jgi:tetratricopeptide (TPR) repeat protein
MKESRIKKVFWLSSAILLLVMLLTSRDAGVSCDEVLHYDHSVTVYNYFASHGTDQSALNTPVTNLKYYGQFYDNIVTFIAKWFNIEDVYSFRHIMSTLAGWLTIIVTALFAVWLTGYQAGILTLILFAVSPTFIGHSHNNLKDIPFALGYIASTFYTLKLLFSGRKIPVSVIVLLTAGIAFTLSIRAGGLLMICYLFLFFFIYYLSVYIRDRKLDYYEAGVKLVWMAVISLIAYILSVLLWPFALQDPLRNVFESYKVMAHYPLTFRQIFEGNVEWSDFMPWYYIPKSMAITIPVLVLTGLVLFVVFYRTVFKQGKSFQLNLIVFTVLFPLFFVIYEKSNLYSSWRQFLFLYPAVVLLAAVGFNSFFEQMGRRTYLFWGGIVLVLILSFHPLKFMVKNHPYYYLYYNQLTGGLKGAYANYETDYYYVSQTEASDWLVNYLGEKNIQGLVKVKATYSVNWHFRNSPQVVTSYFRYEERSLSDWDYAIVVNRYISPYQLNKKIWPPDNAIHIIYKDEVPICAVLERKSKDDFLGYKALSEDRYKDAIKFYSNVITIDSGDEMIFYNFAAALYNDGQFLKADSVLKKGLELNPDFEPILMYLGNIARVHNRIDEAISYYERVIGANRKYFEAYVSLAELIGENDLMRARSLLRTCLTMSPRFKPALSALADTYRKTNPEIAKKYDELIITSN